jgi:hypothetical protein
MRASYLEILRTLLNTIICILLFFAGVELQSNYLQAIAIIMYFSKLIASSERRITWNATQKKSEYRDKFPKN